MADFSHPVILHLNRENCWPDFVMQGLEVDSRGALHLATLPIAEDPTDLALETWPTPAMPGGIVVTDEGRLVWSDPDGGQLFSRDPCDGSIAPLPCFRPGEPFLRPRGLAMHPVRRSVLVADAGSDRLLTLSPDLQVIADSWGGTGDSPGRFREPWSLTTAADHIYVVDRGNRRVQKLDLAGRPVPAFANTVAASGALAIPAEVAAIIVDGESEVFILDAERRQIAIFDIDGGFRRVLALPGIQAPMGLAVGPEAIYVGDNAARAILRLTPAGEIVGRAVGFRAPVAAIVLTAGDILWVSPGGGSSPVRLIAGGGYADRGVLYGGPFGYGQAPHFWGRLSALGAPLSLNAHLRLLWTVSKGDRPPPPIGQNTASWRSGPQEGLDLWIGEEAIALWVGAVFEGDRRSSPHIEQIRVEADRETYSRYLPPLYIRDPEQRPLLDSFLALFESQFVDLEGEINGLAGVFAAQTAPSRWLDWLSGWLDVHIEEAWPDAKRRQAIAEATKTQRERGTRAGLEDALRFELGIRATVQEPVMQAGWWTLPWATTANVDADDDGGEMSKLGFTTMLTAGPAEGAVVGTTATLDHSRLMTDAEFGVPLFDELTHRFAVFLYDSAAVRGKTGEKLRALIEREKPAHTLYQLCVVASAMAVGVQSVIGIDTVLGGGPPAATPVGDPTAAGHGFVLAGDPPARLGQSAIGRSTRLADRGGTLGEE